MVYTTVENSPQPLRLRGLVESWERQGLITHEMAAPLLSRHVRRVRQAAPRRREHVMKSLGYLGATIFLAAGILLTTSGRLGPSLLAAGLALVAVRPNAVRPQPPRHRAGPLVGAHRADRDHRATRGGSKIRTGE